MSVPNATSTSVLDIELDRLSLKTRIRNCCRCKGITTIGQLIQLTAADIIGWRNAGRKTLNEVQALLGSLGLKLSGDLRPLGIIDLKLMQELSICPDIQPQRPNEILLNGATADIQKRLVTRLKGCSLSTRAHNVLVQAGLLYVGELIQLQYRDFTEFQNSGRTTGREFSDLVENQGFRPGTAIPDWSREAATQLEESFVAERDNEIRRQSRELLAASGPTPTYIEEELERILKILEKNNRNVQLLTKLWGWNGVEPRTLESVGQELNLTRERVRQIGDRALRRLKRYKFDTPILKSAITLLRKEVPVLHSQIKGKVQDVNISRGKFSAGSLKSAADILNIKWPFTDIILGGRQNLIAITADATALAKVLSIVRRRTSELGCLNILSLASEIHFVESRSAILRAFLDFMPQVEWLDESKDWLYLRDAPRNRLFNLCSKVLGVSPEIRVSELRRAVGKVRRLAMVPRSGPANLNSAISGNSGHNAGPRSIWQ